MLALPHLVTTVALVAATPVVPHLDLLAHQAVPVAALVANKSALRGYVERMIDEKLASSNPAYPKHEQEALTARENIWRVHGMPEETQAFAAVLYRNNVAPEQVLFDAGCTDYADERAHIAIAQAAENLMREGYESTAESTDDDDDV